MNIGAFKNLEAFSHEENKQGVLGLKNTLFNPHRVKGTSA